LAAVPLVSLLRPFASLLPRYLKCQKPRISEASYRRTKGILNSHLKTAFGAFSARVNSEGRYAAVRDEARR